MNHALLFNVHLMGNRRPVGPYRIASYLREQGWDVEVIEWAAYWSLDQLKDLANSRIRSNTLFCGFGCFFGHWDTKFEDYTSWVKKKWPHVKTVYGSHTFPMFDSNATDYYVIGYGEKAMLELAKSFAGNTSSRILFDPKFFGNKKLISANDSYPAFPLHSLKVIYEERDFLSPDEWLTTELARGCKFACKFCNFPILGVKGDYSRSAKDFDISIRDAYDRFGITNYYISDETINDSTAKLEKFAQVVDKLNFEPLFYGFIRADLMVHHRDSWDVMARLRLLGHYYGIESMNKKSGESIGKGMNPEKLLPGLIEAKEWFRKQGVYRGTVSLICGLPHETEETWWNGIQWCLDNWQGECTNMFALEIPTEEKDAKLSFFSKNYKTLGYRESTVPRNLANENLDLQANYSRQLLNWENDHMNMTRAVQLVEEAYNKLISTDTTVNTWSFSDYSIVAKDAREISTYHARKKTPDYQPLHASYIAKKLK
jgi:radical SAM superfamily enzyme YgiQ (UPF0313 family)